MADDETTDETTTDATKDDGKAEMEANLRASETARVKAEAERDAFMKAMDLVKSAQTQTPQQAQITDEQWQAITEKTGMSKEAYLMNAQIAQQMIAENTRKMEEKLTAAERKAAEAEEKATRSERSRETDLAKSQFYANKPGLSRYAKDVDEFVNRFPESDRNDTKKLAEILNMAETYVKGKVGEKVMRKDATGSARFEHGEDTETKDETIDTSGFKETETRFLRHAQDTRGREKDITDNPATLGSGVGLSGESEWAATEKSYRDQFKKGL